MSNCFDARCADTWSGERPVQVLRLAAAPQVALRQGRGTVRQGAGWTGHERHQDLYRLALHTAGVQGRALGARGVVMLDEISLARLQGAVEYVVYDRMTWARIFGLMEKAKREFNLQDYSVCQVCRNLV